MVEENEREIKQGLQVREKINTLSHVITINNISGEYLGIRKEVM